jgi:hypothetical protein
VQHQCEDALFQVAFCQILDELPSKAVVLQNLTIPIDLQIQVSYCFRVFAD